MKPLVFDGNVFPSKKSAAEAYGISTYALNKFIECWFFGARVISKPEQTLLEFFRDTEHLGKG